MRFNPGSRFIVLFSRTLTADEMLEAFLGPELINVDVPVVSGDAKVGCVLKCSTGKWSLPHPFSDVENGYQHFEYRWCRSPPNPIEEWELIPSATSSEYRVSEEDVQRRLHCVVRGLNDGGFDEAADTPSNSIGPISVA